MTSNASPADLELENEALKARICELENKQHRQRDVQRAMIEIFQLFESTSDLNKLLDLLTQIVKQWTGCDGIGIRMEKDNDFPFQVFKGFDKRFIKKENSLRLNKEPKHEATLDCFCGMVLQSQHVSSNQNFTDFGTFWTNDSSKIQNIIDQIKPTRCIHGTCLTRGYRTMCIIPIKWNNTVLGTLQMNFFKPDQLTIDMINLYQNLAQNIAQAINNHHKHIALQTLSQTNSILFQEIMHRTRNHLQVIASLVSVQEMFSTEPNIKPILFKIRSRINVYNQIQAQLYNENAKLIEIDIAKLIDEIWNYLKSFYQTATKHISISQKINIASLHVAQAGSFGLILHELLLNAIQHAWKDDADNCRIIIEITQAPDLTLTFSDNGQGYNDNNGPDKKFGLTLIETSVLHQLSGKISWTWKPHCICQIAFPLSPLDTL